MSIKVSTSVISIFLWSVPVVFLYFHRLILLSLCGAASLTFLMLACALPSFGVYWPLFVLLFYFLAPLPLIISRRLGDADSTSTACKELSLFFTTGIVISAFGLPCVLAHANVIQWGACAFALAANVIGFLTILGFFIYFGEDSDFEFQRW